MGAKSHSCEAEDSHSFLARASRESSEQREKFHRLHSHFSTLEKISKLERDLEKTEQAVRMARRSKSTDTIDRRGRGWARRRRRGKSAEEEEEKDDDDDDDEHCAMLNEKVRQSKEELHKLQEEYEQTKPREEFRFRRRTPKAERDLELK